MVREISGAVDYLTESFSLLQHLGAGEHYRELKESLDKKYDMPFRGGLRKFEVLEQIEQSAERTFMKDMDAIRFYFPKQQNEAQCHPGRLVLLWDAFEIRKAQDTVAYSAYLTNLSEQAYCEMFGKCLQNYGSALARDDAELIRLENPYDIILYVMKMEFPDEEKWNIQKLFVDRAEHTGKVLGLLVRAEALLRDFKEALSELAGAFCQYWTSLLAERELSAYISEATKINVSASPLGFHLQASIVRPNLMMLNAELADDGVTYKEPDYYRIGILFGEDFDMGMRPAHDQEGAETDVLQVLKLLADRSKFEILSYIRDRAAYGSELARHLNLTTATVSHHMNALLSARLVEVKREEKRVYYTANKKALEEVLAYCRDMLV